MPDVVKNTFASGIPDSADSFSAISTSGALRYSVELCSSLPACSRIASTISGDVVPGDRGEDAAEEVEVLIAVRVEDVPALTPHQLDGFVVVRARATSA